MQSNSTTNSEKREFSWLAGGVILAFLLVAAIWAASYFRAEARVRRATTQVIALAEKAGAESPVSLGLTVNRFGKFLSPQAVLELDEYGALATGRQEMEFERQHIDQQQPQEKARHGRPAKGKGRQYIV